MKFANRLFFRIVAYIIRAIWSKAPPAPAATHDFDGLGRIPTGDGRRVPPPLGQSS
jgi:hypothetical protein